MIKEYVFSQLFDKIPQNAKIAIFGASPVGAMVYKDIIINRKDVQVLNFIDNKQQGTFCDLQVIKFKEFIDNREKYDFAVITSCSAQALVNNVLDVYNIPFSAVDKFILDFYSKPSILDDEKYLKIKNILKEDSDKEVFDLIFKFRRNIISQDKIKEYFNKNYSISSSTGFTLKHQYLDKINKNHVKTLLDLGFNKGTNSIAYYELLKNLEHIYAFEAIYDYCKDDMIEEFILSDKLTIIKSAVGEYNDKTKFYVNTKNIAGSRTEFAGASMQNLPSYIKEVTVDVVNLDDYCVKNNIHPDLIKMDIEGSELSALKGGIKIIKQTRPQLAISIYHSNSDFVNIPLFLYNNLDNYIFKMGHYSNCSWETVLYAIPKELI